MRLPRVLRRYMIHSELRRTINGYRNIAKKAHTLYRMNLLFMYAENQPKIPNEGIVFSSV